MKFLLLVVFISTLSFPQSEDMIIEGEKHFKNIKMITEAGENAEAYLSFDETKLIFQSTVKGLECDQIFTMNIDGSNKKMISNGLGRTTCAYFLPGDKEVIYSSTYLSDSLCPPPPDRSKGYVWKLYETFEIFKANSDGSNITKLVEANGYDAEATVSPKGDKIVFTSTRDGDPELYVMDIDGKNQKRLTFQKGYDGGAFFSLDGKKIVFRASRPSSEKDMADYHDLVQNGYVRPTALEIYVMDADGNNIKQLTNFGKASFAPFMHPDGKRVIFSSNVKSPNARNFDLFMVNTDGTGLEQITFNESFDGFPMFTRDGKKLVFASNRFNKNPNDTNIFVADWVN